MTDTLADRTRATATWGEASTSGVAVAAALEAARIAPRKIADGSHPLARLPLLLPPVRSLALSMAIARGFDPDVPRHLGRVVLLDP